MTGGPSAEASVARCAVAEQRGCTTLPTQRLLNVKPSARLVRPATAVNKHTVYLVCCCHLLPLIFIIFFTSFAVLSIM